MAIQNGKCIRSIATEYEERKTTTRKNAQKNIKKNQKLITTFHQFLRSALLLLICSTFLEIRD